MIRYLLVAAIVLLGCSSDDEGACDTRSYCCCAGDVVDFPVCNSDKPACKSGYRLYQGDDCQCLPDRDTPCCLPHARLDSGIDTATDASFDSAACRDACCCQGDVLDTVQCTDAGPTCKPGYNVYYGDDCTCLPDRNTPCCVVRMFDASSD